MLQLCCWCTGGSAGGGAGCCNCCRRSSCEGCQLVADGACAAGDGRASWKGGGAAGAGAPGMPVPSRRLGYRLVARLPAAKPARGACAGATSCCPAGSGAGCCTSCRAGGSRKMGAGATSAPLLPVGGGGAPLPPGALPGLRISAGRQLGCKDTTDCWSSTHHYRCGLCCMLFCSLQGCQPLEGQPVFVRWA